MHFTKYYLVNIERNQHRHVHSCRTLRPEVRVPVRAEPQTAASNMGRPFVFNQRVTLKKQAVSPSSLKRISPQPKEQT